MPIGVRIIGALPWCNHYDILRGLEVQELVEHVVTTRNDDGSISL